MVETVPVSRKPIEIGRRAAMVRDRQGLSLDLVSGLAGMDADELSLLEGGQRRFRALGQVEDLAAALGCPVTVLTGQPYLPGSRVTADALAVVPGIRAAVGAALDDPTGVAPRPVADLVRRTGKAQEHLDQDRFARAGRKLEPLITELQAHAATGDPRTRDAALGALVPTCHVAAVIAGVIGYHDLALSSARRGLDAAARLGDPVVLGLARLTWTGAWINVGARAEAGAANRLALSELGSVADPSATDSAPAELLGMHHLLAATLAARVGRADDVADHLAEARTLAVRVGERNTFSLHFGPTNVALWTLSLGADLGEGPRDLERVERAGLDVATLHSRERTGTYHLDAARALSQHGGDRDDEAVHHLGLADRAAPVRTRNNPIARELTEELTDRARALVRDVDSLMARFGLAGQRSQSVNN